MRLPVLVSKGFAPQKNLWVVKKKWKENLKRTNDELVKTDRASLEVLKGVRLSFLHHSSHITHHLSRFFNRFCGFFCDVYRLVGLFQGNPGLKTYKNQQFDIRKIPYVY